MLLGKLAKKPSPGTQENQNVPIGVVPVSCRVMLYCQSDGPSGSTATDANAIITMEPLPTDQVLAGLPHSTDATRESADFDGCQTRFGGLSAAAHFRELGGSNRRPVLSAAAFLGQLTELIAARLREAFRSSIRRPAFPARGACS